MQELKLNLTSRKRRNMIRVRKREKAVHLFVVFIGGQTVVVTETNTGNRV
jgi:hypothetical protein